MISRALRRLSRRHPGAALAITTLILLGGTALLVVWTIRDLGRGNLIRPIAGLAAMIVIAIWLASTGLRRRV
jgi:FtsH-binding integral membrane protein